MRIIDGDGHVAVGASLVIEAMQRWPQHITTRTDGRPRLMIEGRNYPEDRGLHEHFEKRGAWIERGWRRDPSEYLQAGNVWVSCEPEEPILPGVIDVLGADFVCLPATTRFGTANGPRARSICALAPASARRRAPRSAG